MDLEKIPEVVDSVVNNQEKSSETFEKRPMGSAMYYICGVSIAVCFYLGWQNNKLQEKNNEYGEKMMEQNFRIQNAKDTIRVQKNTINVQSEAINKAITKMSDSMHVVNLKTEPKKLKR